jgi:signal transduction histidine kinase/ActR/RegA family two-component response regulator/PAS domain-containing protein
MKSRYRFRDWPLRRKVAVLLVFASLVPLGLATWLSIREARRQLLLDTSAVLAARGDQVVGRIDTFIHGYEGAVQRLSRVPGILRMLQADPKDRAPLQTEMRGMLAVWPESDPQIRGVSVLDARGVVVVDTATSLTGVSLAYRSFVQKGLQGLAVISDVHISETASGAVPTFAVLEPIWGPDGKQLGLAAFWVRASALSEIMKQSNGQAGPGSFAILFDQLGVRIAHSFLDEIVLHPGVPLSPATIDAQVAEERFGPATRKLLTDVRQVSAGFQLGTNAIPVGMFRGYAPGNNQWNHVIARRCQTVNWTAYYLVPEVVVQNRIAGMTRDTLLLAAVILMIALVAGSLFAAVILRPLRALSGTARAIAGGNSAARVGLTQQDELGELGRTFDAMASRLQTQTAELAQQSEAQYRALFESLTEGFCTIEMIFDTRGEAVDFLVLDTNPAFFQHTGIADAEGKRIREILPDLETYWFETFKRIAVTGSPESFENYAAPLRRHYEVSGFRVGGEGSRRVAIVFTDITDRKDREIKRQAQLERLALLQQITRAIGDRQDLPSIYQIVIRTLEDQLPIDFGCICLYERDSNQLVVTRVGLRSQELAMELALTEHARFDIDGNGLSSCVRGKLVYEPDVREVDFPFPQRVAKSGLRALVAAPLVVESQVFGVLIAARLAPDSFSSIECEFLQQLSEHVALAAHQANLYNALHAAYEDLRQNQQAAMQQERLRSLGQMASGIAHDINNAISPVALYTDSLLEREPGLSEQGRGQLQTIQRAIHDVAATVARMREFYRQREPQVLLAPVQLNELVPQIVELTRARWSAIAQQRGATIEMRTELQPDLPIIMGAENELREALTNLVLNAVDAMPDGGVLTMRTRATATAQVQIEVSDTGVGMDEDARRRCLEPFFTTKGERGTGLGLAMVYGVVQRHSADVEIESEVGKGTTIRLIFAESVENIAPVLATAVAVLNGLRILVVDDDPVLLRSLRDTLEGDRHTVVAANGGKDGIEQFRAAKQQGQPFDVVITDLGMPYVDGRQVATSIKSASPRTPVIMLTGWGQRLVADGDIPQDVDMVLSKPPKLRDLREALVQACKSSL